MQNQFGWATVSDAELALRINGGERCAEDELVTRFMPKVVGVLQKRLQGSDQVDDLAQSTILASLCKLRNSKLEDPAKLQHYILRTATYQAMKSFSRKKFIDQCSSDRILQNEISPDPDLFDQMQFERMRMRIRRMLSKMVVPRDREILTRYYIYEQTKPVVCQALNLDSAHFDRVLYRAKSRFRQLLEQDDT